MERKDLQKKERDLLKDIEKFNVEHGLKGWGLKNRIVEKMEIRGIKLHGSTIRNVQFIFCKFPGAEFKNVKFINSSFEHVEFSYSNFTNCIFENCELMETRIHFSKLDGCTFTGLNAVMGGPMNSGIYNSSFANVSFVESKLDNFHFRDSIVEKTKFDKVEFWAVDLDVSKKLQFTNCNLRSLSIEKSENVIFENCNGGAVGLRSFVNVKLSNINNLHLWITKSNADSVEIIDSASLLVTINKATLSNIVIKGCIPFRITIQNSKINGGYIENCSIGESRFVTGSIIKNLLIKNSSFDQNQELVDVTFENLKFENVQFQKNYKLEFHEKVTYTNSEKFKGAE